MELAIRVGLALGSTVSPSTFARKNYFYPDLPKCYQISQFELPLNGKGHLDIEVDGETLGDERANKKGTVRVQHRRLHVEIERRCPP
mgnify:CR=1 FL=1